MNQSPGRILAVAIAIIAGFCGISTISAREIQLSRSMNEAERNYQWQNTSDPEYNKRPDHHPEDWYRTAHTNNVHNSAVSRGLSIADLDTSTLSTVTSPPIDPQRLPPRDFPLNQSGAVQDSPCRQGTRLPHSGSVAEWSNRYPTPNLRSLWPITRGRGQVIAIIDTGVYPSSRLPTLQGGGDFTANGRGLEDCDAHGTIVAGIIAARPAQDGYAGIAPDATLISIRQSSAHFSLPSSSSRMPQSLSTVQSLAVAVRLAVDQGATIINISQAACQDASQGLWDEPLGAALDYAVNQHDVLVVVAAGNMSQECSHNNPVRGRRGIHTASGWGGLSTLVSPAWYDNLVLTVGSVDSNGAPSAFSIAGPWVDVAAPGEHIQSLNNSNEGPTIVNASVDAEGKAIPLGGTSFAAPYVAGTAALLRARYPDASAFDVMSRIISTAHSPASGQNTLIGSGIVDPVAAVTGVAPELNGQVSSRSLPRSSPSQEHTDRSMTVAILVFATLILGSLPWWRARGSTR